MDGVAPLAVSQATRGLENSTPTLGGKQINDFQACVEHIRNFKEINKIVVILVVFVTHSVCLRTSRVGA